MNYFYLPVKHFDFQSKKIYNNIVLTPFLITIALEVISLKF